MTCSLQRHWPETSPSAASSCESQRPPSWEPIGSQSQAVSKKWSKVTLTKVAQHQSSLKPPPWIPGLVPPPPFPVTCAAIWLPSSCPAQFLPFSHALSQPHGGTQLGPAGPSLDHGRRRVGRARSGVQLCCADICHIRLHSHCQMPGIWPCQSGSCGCVHGTHTLGGGMERLHEETCPQGKRQREP